MTMELLNLDELVSAKRTVTIHGTDYTLASQTLDQMLNAIQATKAAEEAGTEGSPEDVLKSMKSTCMSLLPDCPEEEIGRLSMRQMTALIEFASQSDQEVEDAVSGDAAEGTTGK